MSGRDIALALICVFLWGANFPLIKLIIDDMPPTLITGFRLLFIGMIGARWLKIYRGEWFKLFLISLTLYTLPLILVSYALKSVNSTIVSIMNNFEIVVAVLIDALVLKTKIRRIEYLGIAMAFIGGNIIFISPEVTNANYLGIILAVCAAVAYSISSFQIKAVNIPPFGITVWSAIIGSVQCFVFSFIDSSIWNVDFSAMELRIWVVLSISAITSFLAFLLWSTLLRRNDVFKVSAFAVLIPVMALFISFIISDERVHHQALIGGGICIFGMIFLSLPNKKQP